MTPTHNKLVRLPIVKELTGLSRSAIYARLNPNSSAFDSTFPKQVKLSPGPRGASAWYLPEIVDWVASRLRARQNLSN